MLDTSYFTMKN